MRTRRRDASKRSFCQRQGAGQRPVEVIARGLEVEDEPRSPGGEKLQLGEQQGIAHRIDELDGKALAQHGGGRLIVARRCFDERPQQEAVAHGCRLHLGRRQGAQRIARRGGDVARAVEVGQGHAHPGGELKGLLPLGGGGGLEGALGQGDGFDIAADKDELGDGCRLSCGRRRRRCDQARGDGEGCKPVAHEPAAAARHGLSVSR